ncbi:hypothetical protein [Silvimonas amylolytica]|uniref:Uncharacterized protein n=1 Tax=Silvimonas amylolytica TaxID=449663 RepID=A0ABQ2PIE7_9NEIS|nr:hypothetical protein [Silvimonas amylolytica]GGP25005.1 hypothetical protein GCM10010971_08240 [Silvimonas amylolytica]
MPRFALTGLLTLVCATPIHAAPVAPTVGAPFAVTGERVTTQIPKGWKLAWMQGDPAGGFMAEYLPEGEDINHWRGEYLAIARFPYPSATVLKQMTEKKVHISEVALSQFMSATQAGCGGKRDEMPHGLNQIDGLLFAVSGGFCDKLEPAAPFGEGQFVAFIEGKDFLHKVQYSWRPGSAFEASANKPMRLPKQKTVQYLEAIKASRLCDGSYKACTGNFL